MWNKGPLLLQRLEPGAGAGAGDKTAAMRRHRVGDAPETVMPRQRMLQKYWCWGGRML